MRHLNACALLTALAMSACTGASANRPRAELVVPWHGERLDQFAALAVDATHLYWLHDGALRRMATAGGAAETLAEHPDARLEGLAIDEGVVYYTDGDGGSILAFDVRRRAARALATAAGRIRALAVDGGSVYVTTFGGRVLRVAKGGGPVEVIADRQPDPESIGVDDTHVYWTNTGPLGAANRTDLMRVAKRGGAPEHLDDRCSSLAVEATFIYCADHGAGEVLRLAKRDGQVAQVAAADRSPSALAVGVQRVYWLDEDAGSGDGALVRVTRTGGAPEIVVRHLPSPRTLVVQPGTIWWIDRDGIHRVAE